MRIAILDADVAHAEFIENVLERGGHTCHLFRRGKPFLLKMRRDTFDAAVVTENIADGHTHEILNQVRQHAPSVPVLVVAVYAREAHIVDILNAGADDCMPDPPRGAELLARINALLRLAHGTSPASTAVAQFKDHIFDPGRRIVRAYGNAITLTQKEFSLALLLFNNMSRELSRNYILEAVWQRQTGVSSRTLDTHASRLRKKLGLIPSQGYRLTAVYSHGYRLVRLAAPAV
ncbi:MAG: response regulator transcription factor [Janthinobacterium lividum]